MKSSKWMIVCLCTLFLTSVFGQRRSNQFKASDLAKMPIVYIDLIEKSYPRSYLDRVSNSSITIVNRTFHERTLRPMYFSGVVPLDQIKHITIISKKRKWQTNLIGGAIGGAAGYFLGRQFRPDRIRQANIELIDQPPSNGFIEPILGGILGVGLGVVIGDLFTPVHIDNVNSNPRQAVRTLREHSPKKKKRR
ncbi:MAG: hypothetical protein HKN76_06815 [Saprospiraceae bacterium]|nr:hypothetical protein [Saprospiraceae bacterium]